jgi:hypothetical protein
MKPSIPTKKKKKVNKNIDDLWIEKDSKEGKQNTQVNKYMSALKSDTFLFFWGMQKANI